MSRNRWIRWWLVPLLMVPSVVLAAGPWQLDGTEWARPRSAATVAAMPPVAAAVRDWSRTRGAELVLQYPRGEAGLLWAEELRDWLVALGVPADAMALQASGTASDALFLSIRRAAG